MKILRIDSEKGIDREISTLHIEIDGCIYRLIEDSGRLNINKSSETSRDNDKIAIYPRVSNSIDIK